MKKAERASQARRHLDERLGQRDLAALVPPPHGGWIRAIRDALGMTGRDLAHRLSVSGAAVSQMERSEVDGGIRLDSLRRVADALDCDLVYGLLPRTTLDDTVRRQATARAARDVAMVDQMMRLEAQDLDPAELEHQVRDYADTLIREGRLWSSGVR